MNENIKNFIRKLIPYRVLYHRAINHGDRDLAVLHKILNGKGAAIDIGANKGVYTYSLLRLCKYEQVYAFEPNPKLYRLLHEKTRRFKNASLYNVGLSNISGELKLNIPFKNGNLDSACGSLNKINEPHQSFSVPVNTLDSYNFSNIEFIKIDVEGYEWFVLDGAERTILKSKPVLFVEIEQRHLDNANITITVQDVINKVLSWGYSCFYFEDDIFKRVDMSAFSIELFQVEITKRYINNFWFFQDGKIINSYKMTAIEAD